MSYDDELRMRPTRLNGDVAGPNDYVVIWRDITVGRILQQPSTPIGNRTGSGASTCPVRRSRPRIAEFAATSKNASDASRWSGLASRRG